MLGWGLLGTDGGPEIRDQRSSGGERAGQREERGLAQVWRRGAGCKTEIYWKQGLDSFLQASYVITAHL